MAESIDLENTIISSIEELVRDYSYDRNEIDNLVDTAVENVENEDKADDQDEDEDGR